MKVAIVHSFYSDLTPSGENVVVEAQAELLRASGFQVELFATRTGSTQSIVDKVRSAVRVGTGLGRSPLSQIHQFRPDVVHVHNLFPNWSTQWLGRVQVPVVATLHNFRTACAKGTHFRDGVFCRLCPDSGSTMPAIENRCYRDSVVATLPLAVANRRGVEANPLVEHATRLISLSPRAGAIHTANGVPADRLTVIPNFVSPTASDPKGHDRGRDVVYVGRLAEEKGIRELLDSWAGTPRLQVYGSGPMEVDLIRDYGDRADFHGAVSPSDVMQVLKRAAVAVVPSLWVESAFPLSYIEPISVGTPVVALRGNCAADDIDAFGTGAAVDLIHEIQGAAVGLVGSSMAQTASYNRYSTEFTPHVWLGRIRDLYESL